jgi:hypothetical protein
LCVVVFCVPAVKKEKAGRVGGILREGRETQKSLFFEVSLPSIVFTS